MTALPIRAPQSTDLVREPSLRRLLGAAIVAGLGAIALSVAVASNFVGSMQNLPGASVADAHALGAAVPWIVGIGIVHLVIATAIAAGREVVRMIAAVLTGLAALAAAAATAMTAAGVDPIGSSSSSAHPTATGVGILAVLAVLYGAAALLAGGVAEES